jgi:hypothetical protein
MSDIVLPEYLSLYRVIRVTSISIYSPVSSRSLAVFRNGKQVYRNSRHKIPRTTDLQPVSYNTNHACVSKNSGLRQTRELYNMKHKENDLLGDVVSNCVIWRYH